ncbi:hypothetical protein BJY00DRAFT_320116 [Aspergillus carlsbadensis]|nr:hypothetical protein BJY00DRAFT_320116 [Aspergillus carlsbadensis]
MLASRVLPVLLYLCSFCSDRVTAVVVVPASVTVRNTASNLFQIGDDTTGGACSAEQIATVDSWLSECVDILNAALTAYHSYSTSDTYRKMFRLWLSMLFDGTEIEEVYQSYWDVIGTRLAGVATFLSGGGITGGTADVPFLFCGDDFAQRQTWATAAIDANGDEMVRTSNEEGTPTEYYAIEDVYPNLRALQLDAEILYEETKTSADEAKDDSGATRHIAPFLVSHLNAYVFDASGKASLCLKPGRIAATSRADNNAGAAAGSPDGFAYASFNRHIYLCDIAFEPKVGETHGYATLAEVVSYENYPTPGVELDPSVAMSLSSTFFHELIHLTDAQGTDNDGPGGNYYRAKIVMPLSWNLRERALIDAPEPYTFFSMGAYIAQNPPTTPAGGTAKPAVFYGPPGWIYV